MATDTDRFLSQHSQQVLSCEGVQFSGDLSRQTIVLSHCLLVFHLSTNLLANAMVMVQFPKSMDLVVYGNIPP